jgi:hypothetical protein
MTSLFRTVAVLLVVATSLTGAACELKRPETIATRMLEPQLLEAQSEKATAQASMADARPIRLLETQARGHIGRRLLHQQPSGELTEDPVWRWSSTPDRYLDTAIRLEVASHPALRLMDSPNAGVLAATLLIWNIEAAEGGTHLVGAVEFQFTGLDRAVHTNVMRGSEPVSAELPGDLAAVAGRLLRRLADQGLQSLADQ